MLLLLALLGCADPPAPAPAAPPVAPPEPVAAPNPDAGAAGEGAHPAGAADPGAEAVGAPAGSIVGTIGGEPILPNVIVLGALSTDAVTGTVGMHQAKLDACYAASAKTTPGLAGKVLVTLKIGRDGRVQDATITSTSLRDPDTEACLAGVLLGVRFPKLPDGDVAIVRYPFTFGATTPR